MGKRMHADCFTCPGADFCKVCTGQECNFCNIEMERSHAQMEGMMEEGG